MILFNPTDQTITVQIRGNEHTVEPQGFTKHLTEEDAVYWMGLHAFLTPKVEEVKEVKEVKEKVIKKK